MAAIEMPLRHRPAVVLIDVRLGSGINGVEAAQGICEKRPRRVIFPTGSNEIATAFGSRQRLRPTCWSSQSCLSTSLEPSDPCRVRLDSEHYQGGQFPDDAYQAFEDLRCDSRYLIRTEGHILQYGR